MIDLDEALEMAAYAVHVGDERAIQRWRAELNAALTQQREEVSTGEGMPLTVTGRGRDREQGTDGPGPPPPASVEGSEGSTAFGGAPRSRPFPLNGARNPESGTSQHGHAGLCHALQAVRGGAERVAVDPFEPSLPRERGSGWGRTRGGALPAISTEEG